MNDNCRCGHWHDDCGHWHDDCGHWHDDCRPSIHGYGRPIPPIKLVSPPLGIGPRGPQGPQGPQGEQGLPGDATAASQAAAAAQASARDAAAAASAAQASAVNALVSLSTVQSVAETLEWITEHGTMTLTSDTSLDPTHIYFVQDADGDYVVGGVHYSLVSEPDEDDLPTYYELSIDESLNNYVGTHLALTDEGLWLLPADPDGAYKVLIATGAGSTYTTAGTYVIDGSGTAVASFTSDAVRMGTADGNNIDITDNDIGFSMPYDDGNGHTGTVDASMYTDYGTYRSAAGHGQTYTVPMFHIKHGTTDLTLLNNGLADLTGSLKLSGGISTGSEDSYMGGTLAVGVSNGYTVDDTTYIDGDKVHVLTALSGSTPMVQVTNGYNNKSASLRVSNGNRGVYDDTNSKWIIYANDSNGAVVNGMSLAATGTSANTNNYWTLINASTGVGIRLTFNPNPTSLNLVATYTLDGGANWSGTKTIASWTS